MFRLDEKSNTERLSNQKQENDRFGGHMNMGSMIAVYQMYCGGERTRGRRL